MMDKSDLIVENINRIKSYLLNAKGKMRAGEYDNGVEFIECAEVEIENLKDIFNDRQTISS